MIDCGFPVIRYAAGDSPLAWGRQHGESWRDAIAELVAIRKSLMHEKAPHLTQAHIDRLAEEQWLETNKYDYDLTLELLGICQGANVSRADLIILNNYTDFRDIQMTDEGCSVVFVNYDRRPVAGQTWDMHGSAKRYVSCLEVPCPGFDAPMVLFSLVGCLGMMGFHPDGRMIGVNNVNTHGAEPGAIWPAVIRKTLAQPDHEAMDRELAGAPVTGGHAYLLASPDAGEFWEVMPGLAERVQRLETDRDGFLFHTNHCLGEVAQHREFELPQNSTTYVRYNLIEKKIPAVRTFDDVYVLMNDHENYPKSICSNFQTDSQDPSITCGGAVGDLTTGRIRLWRGDEMYDDNFVSRDFDLGVPHVA